MQIVSAYSKFYLAVISGGSLRFAETKKMDKVLLQSFLWGAVFQLCQA